MTEIQVEYGLKTRPASSFIHSSSDSGGVYISSRSGSGRILVDSDQLWFWTNEWLDGEQRVQEYIRAGNVQEFDDMEGFLLSLED